MGDDAPAAFSEINRHFFETLARWGKPGDVWMQVGRAAGTVAIDDAQVDLLVGAIRAALELAPDDVVLDLACGNGALGRRLAEGARALHGVDFAETMIAAARALPPDARCTFELGDIETFVRSAPEPERFTKGLCSFAFQYLSPDAAGDVLRELRRRFTSLRRFYVGDMPDRDRVGDVDLLGFRPQPEGYESPLGLWRTTGEFVELARRAGWSARILATDPAYYAAHYRFEAILVPSERPSGGLPPRSVEG